MKENKKWYKKISSWIFLIVCLILGTFLVFNVSIMIQASQNKDKVPSVFGYKPFIVLSGSMETEIYVGDLIITKVVDPATLEKDDIIAFRDDQNTVTTHRIIEIVEKDGETYFVTKGDNNNSQDQNLVEYDDVEGIYITRIPQVGNIMSSLSEPTTVVILVLGITVIFGAGFMISTKKQSKLEQSEFLEYKKQKELEAKKEAKEEVAKEEKKTSKSKK